MSAEDDDEGMVFDMSFFSSIGKALKSKTVWAGIGTTALGVANFAVQAVPVIAPYVPATSPVGAGLAIALGLLTIYGRVNAKQPLGPVIGTTVQKTLAADHEMQGELAPPSAAHVALVTGMVKGLPATAPAAPTKRQ